MARDGYGELRGAELAESLRARLTRAAIAANLLGALTAFVFGFISPVSIDEVDQGRLLLLNAAGFVVFMGTTLPLGNAWSRRIVGLLNATGSSELGAAAAVIRILGGATTCAVAFLLVERIARPVMALALDGDRRPGRLLASEAALSRVRGEECERWSLGEAVTLHGRDEPTRLVTLGAR